MKNSEWIRKQLETQEVNGIKIKEDTKNSIDKMTFRKNMITGEETLDSKGLLFTEWNGLFFDLTGRKPTETEFILFSDWLDETKCIVNEPIYDQFKVFFNKLGIPMLPKIKKIKKETLSKLLQNE